jgi:hypothetical protein
MTTLRHTTPSDITITALYNQIGLSPYLASAWPQRTPAGLIKQHPASQIDVR